MAARVWEREARARPLRAGIPSARATAEPKDDRCLGGIGTPASASCDTDQWGWRRVGAQRLEVAQAPPADLADGLRPGRQLRVRYANSEAVGELHLRLDLIERDFGGGRKEPVRPDFDSSEYIGGVDVDLGA